MARRPNYGFEKRQKEMLKQQKKDEKEERKRARKAEEQSGDAPAETDDAGGEG
ncbi:MAG: hypothetical protein AVDCRST_MAG68-230 [uncultured Gemmatimonadetes bacterium]|uniref:Uncharacterized protein n=2 Tax=uncultured Gemmatimonadota bacterium TaxID=203437 RepID=A0A6J4K9Z8_9BACT|nr:MAG: hypothetical protein AVDCRST_MAG68-230 [uncultured Gemmatimonadota bacterium]